MGQNRALVLLALVVHSYAAPQFITFKEGKLGVNFGGYHAGVGLGGAAGNGAAGGLFAEAGTPHGQAARAGLGGAVDGSSVSAGGLFAGATAGGNVRASTGLGGAAGAGHSAGAGYAAASAGAHEAASGLGGESSGSGSSSFKFSGSKSYGIPTAVVKETEVSVVPVQQTHGHKVHTELKLNTDNEIQHTDTDSNIDAHVEVKASAPAVVVKEVYVEPQPQIIEKTIVHTHYKPSHHHHKTAYIGGFIGGAANIPPPPPPPPVQKRIDIGVDSSAHVEGGFGGSHVAEHGNGGQVTYKKEVVIDNNQNFFRDIFNIPISTLQAVGNLLSNTAASTSVKVEKSATVEAGGYGQAGGYHQAEGLGQGSGRVQLEKDVNASGQLGGYGQGSGYGQAGGVGNFAKSFQFGGFSQFNHESDTLPKHASHSQSSSSSDAKITVETPNASNFFADIFAIPINTLGAVNKFLENNVSGRKRIQVTQDGSEGVAESRVRLGPHARRRANKRVVILHETPEEGKETN